MANGNDFIEDLMDMTFEQALKTIALAGATQRDSEWAETRAALLETIDETLDTARAHIRHNVAESMFRMDEDE